MTLVKSSPGDDGTVNGIFGLVFRPAASQAVCFYHPEAGLVRERSAPRSGHGPHWIREFCEMSMNVRRLVLDVDKALARPTIIDIANAITTVPSVEAVNITVTEIDVETVGMDVTIEGDGLDYDAIAEAIEHTGAVVHSIDQLVTGRIIERVARSR